MELYRVAWWQVLIGSSLRYFLFAGVAYLFFYHWQRHTMARFRIQDRMPRRSAIQTEIKYSLSTIVIFAAVIYITLFTPVRDHTLIYNKVDAYPHWWFFLSLLMTVVFHDTYFYWMHRLMHWKPIFPYAHHIHHRSHNPTPLAAFSFHPIEAIVEIGVLPLMLFLMPVHRLVLGLFGLYMIVMNVVGHLGYELLPESFIKSPLGRIFNSSTHHNMHHHYGRSNYGLYFNLWDRMMGTNHPHYEETFVRVSHKAQTVKKDNNFSSAVKPR